MQACKQGNTEAVELFLADGQIDGSDRKLFVSTNVHYESILTRIQQKCMKNLLELDNPAGIQKRNKKPWLFNYARIAE